MCSPADIKQKDVQSAPSFPSRKENNKVENLEGHSDAQRDKRIVFGEETQGSWSC
jgi:hypothetical protein